MPHSFQLRTIEPRDDAAMAHVIRAVMPEFGAGGDGFAIHDAEVDTMHAAYTAPRCAYFVVEIDAVVAGGGGIAPLEHGDGDTCELRKMYFLPEARGQGAGHAVMRRCLDAAREQGFKYCYIETLSGMEAAFALYRKYGFEPLDSPLGQTGHHGCDHWFMRAL
ncbi:MAG TPA: GNAT family N-acetyltransferase [Oleiagrimonas sp.]|nr:GNAT family N-acetyltransferase [Oleiagrimonas sp.]